MDDSYSLALMVQNASNLSGVGHDFGKLCTMVREEYAAANDGDSPPTSYIAQHPAVYLYVAKMAEMVGIFCDTEEYGKALRLCEGNARTKWHVRR